MNLFQDGQIRWQKAIGGSGLDIATVVVQNQNGQFLVSGTSNSINGDVKIPKGEYDIWTVLFNNSGDILWQRSYGGSKSEAVFSILQYSPNQYILTGYTFSTNGDVLESNGNSDVWMFQILESSELQWQQTFGSSSFDGGTNLKVAKDKGLILSGYNSIADYDVTSNNGEKDFWVIKFLGIPTSGVLTSSDTICKNSFVDFTAQSNDSVVQIKWILEGAEDSIQFGKSVVGVYPETGTYSISVITTNQFGSDTLKIQNRIVVLPSPKPDFTGLLVFCSGAPRIDAYFPVNRRISSSYEWRVMNNESNSYPWEPGSGRLVDWATDSATITLIETILATGCKDSITKQIRIIKSPDTKFTFEYDSLCPNTVQTYTRTTQVINSVYFWNISTINLLIPGREILDTTENSITINWERPGFFAVDLFGRDTVTKCTTLTRKLITVNYEPVPIISPIKDTICGFNRKTYYNANPKPTSTYQWSVTNGRIVHQTADSVVIQWFAVGYGNVTLTETFAEVPCPGSRSLTQVITANLNKPTVTRLGSQLTASTATEYQWYFNQKAVPGATQQTFTITEEGFYSVFATFVNGECGGFSDIVSTVTTVAENERPKYMLQPNPSNGVFRFTSSFESTTLLSIDVVSSLGISILSLGNFEANGSFQKELNCSSLPTGVYFLRVQSNNNTRILPFLKNE